MRKTITVLTAVIALTVSMMGAAIASSTLLDPFTSAELEDNWTVDRQFPSGGVTSVSAHGRSDVAAVAIVGELRSTQGSFRYFEGIKKVGDFGPTVQVDLYMPSEWATVGNGPLNIGFWTSDDPISAYPLIVFRNSATVDAGFYVYNTQTGAYAPSGVEVRYDGWNTLQVVLDADSDTANYLINGQAAGLTYAANNTIGQVFLNHFNDGVTDYTAHWHAGVIAAPSANDCKKGGFAALGFRNQGQCVSSFVANTNANRR